MIQHLEADEARQKYDEKVEFIDVRERHEHQQVRIPGSKIIPLSEMNRRWEEIPRDRPVVIYCQSGNRSASLIMQLNQMGFENLYNLYGGIISWYQNRHPVDFGAVEAAG